VFFFNSPSSFHIVSLCFPFGLDNVLTVVRWLGESFSEPELLVTWQVAMSCVVDVLSDSINQWIVESIELIVGKRLIVLDTIAVSIGDLAAVPARAFLAFAKLQQRLIILLDEAQVLWTLNVVNEEGEAALSVLDLQVLAVAHAIGHFGVHFALAQILSGQLGLSKCLWWARSIVLLLSFLFFFLLISLWLWLWLLNWLGNWSSDDWFWRWFILTE